MDMTGIVTENYLIHVPRDIRNNLGRGLVRDDRNSYQPNLTYPTAYLRFAAQNFYRGN
jgi:hypothetical protein